MSHPNKPLTPEEQRAALARQALGPEARELEAMSDEEVDAELRALGVDPERVEREGRELADRLLGRASAVPAPTPSESAMTEAPPLDLRPGAGGKIIQMPQRRARWPLLLVAAAAAFVVVPTGLMVATRDMKDPNPVTDAERAPPELPALLPTHLRAKKLREEALKECSSGAWRICEDRLDTAKKIDPRGEEMPDVIDMRRTVNAQRRHAEKVKMDAMGEPDGGRFEGDLMTPGPKGTR